MTYWGLNAVFLGVVAALVLVGTVRGRRPRWAAIAVATAALLIVTAVFDNVMISIGLVAYDESLISGAFVGVAPLEDFAYAIAAVVGLPALWALLPSADRSAGRARSARRRPSADPAPSAGRARRSSDA